MTATFEPPRRNAEATKKRLLDAAEEEFAAKGFDGARLSNIARGASAQQALIHHYFSDKDGLFRAVIARGFEAMTAEGWGILARFGPKMGKRKAMSPADVRDMVESFVDLMLRFYASHGSFMAIMRHEAQRGGGLLREATDLTVKPQFEAVVARVEEMRARGEVRADVDARHFCISAVAMAWFPFAEEHFLASVWPVDPRSPAFCTERKREIVHMLLARLLG